MRERLRERERDRGKRASETQRERKATRERNEQVIKSNTQREINLCPFPLRTPSEALKINLRCVSCNGKKSV